MNTKGQTMQMVVLHKAGKWYCKYPQYGSWPEKVMVNTELAERCPDPQWCFILSEPKSVQVWVQPSRRLTGYERKPEYADLNITVPNTVDCGFFEYVDDGRINSQFFEFYQGTYEEIPGRFEPLVVDIVIADMDAEPCQYKFPVRISYPAAFAEVKEIHHKFPCTVSSADLFEYAYKKIDAVVQSSKNLKRDDFKSIQSLKVERRFVYAEPQKRRRDVSGWNSRKPRYQEYLEKEKWDTIISICAANRDYGEKVPSISADNYFELERKVDEYVNALLNQLDDSLIEQCPTCKGCGWLRRDVTP